MEYENETEISFVVRFSFSHWSALHLLYANSSLVRGSLILVRNNQINYFCSQTTRALREIGEWYMLDLNIVMICSKQQVLKKKTSYLIIDFSVL